MHIALKGCRPPHTNEPVQFWIGFGLILIGGSGLNHLGLLAPHWIIQLVIDRNAIKKILEKAHGSLCLTPYIGNVSSLLLWLHLNIKKMLC